MMTDPIADMLTRMRNALGSGAMHCVVPGSKLKEYVDTINSCYPEEIVRYYSPGYSDTLMEKIDNYSLPGGA